MDVKEVYKIADDAYKTNTNTPATYLGIYRAKCVDPKDPKKSGRVKVWIPQLMKGKVEDTEGRWALPASTFAATNIESKEMGVDDFGNVNPPPKDSFVYVFFEGGDPDKPRYISGAVLENNIPTEGQAGAQYWNKSVVQKRPSGKMVFMSDDPTDNGVIIRGTDRSKSKRAVKGDPRRLDSHELVLYDKKGDVYSLLRSGSGLYCLLDETKNEIRIQHTSGSYILFTASGEIHIQAASNIHLNSFAANYIPKM